VSRATNERGGTSLRRFKPYPAYKDSGVEWLGDIAVYANAHLQLSVDDLRLVMAGNLKRLVDLG